MFQSQNGTITRKSLADSKPILFKFQSQNGTITRHKKRATVLPVPSFNPKMVQLQAGLRIGDILRFTVSIPKWYNYKQYTGIKYTVQVMFQSQNGTITSLLGFIVDIEVF